MGGAPRGRRFPADCSERRARPDTAFPSPGSPLIDTRPVVPHRYGRPRTPTVTYRVRTATGLGTYLGAPDRRAPTEQETRRPMDHNHIPPTVRRTYGADDLSTAPSLGGGTPLHPS
ncbi:hypothetical protein GCM10010502_03170 [Kitasatospora aureofaciens]|uniref:Uncharacterized protein n=1 Tax=Kitasatospora aureofaciens TaxID=1894 RepID=A0A8H9HHI0_KITAU|nr:hypothetical protein GCM10010502_03170 [Kitasatospora aureofaciens]